MCNDGGDRGYGVGRGGAGRGGARGRGELQNSCYGDQVCDGDYWPKYAKYVGTYCTVQYYLTVLLKNGAGVHEG